MKNKQTHTQTPNYNTTLKTENTYTSSKIFLQKKCNILYFQEDTEETIQKYKI